MKELNVLPFTYGVITLLLLVVCLERPPPDLLGSLALELL